MGLPKIFSGLKCVLVVLWALLGARVSVPAQELDTTFNISPGTYVYRVALQPDGKILVSGNFPAVSNAPNNAFVRLNPDGSVDPSFAPQIANAPFVIAVQADGKILVDVYQQQGSDGPGRNLARLLPNGSLDETFNPGPNSNVFDIVPLRDGKILVNGNFTVIGEKVRPYLARLHPNGETDESFYSDLAHSNGPANCLAVDDVGRIFVVPPYTQRLHRLLPDGATDTTFAKVEFDAGPSCLAVQPNGQLVVAGQFTSANGKERLRLARVSMSGFLDPFFDPKVVNAVSFTAVNGIHVLTDGRILISGNFSSVEGQPRTNLAMLNADGSLNTQFNPYFYTPSITHTLGLFDGKLLVGGGFYQFGQQSVAALVKLDLGVASAQHLTQSQLKQIRWQRSGTLAEVSDVNFELWDGAAWQLLGQGMRVPGGWELGGLQLPARGRLRALGRVYGGIGNKDAGFAAQTLTYGDFSHPLAPVFTQMPQSAVVDSGSSVSFLVMATGTQPLSYQWRRNGVNIAKATASSYSIPKVLSAQTGSYDVVVKNAHGTALSAPAVLSLSSFVTISQGPSSVVLAPGATAAFSVTATGATAYQWLRDGKPLAGATQAALSIPNVGVQSAGLYSVAVTGQGGVKVTSAPAQLSVREPGLLLYKVAGSGTSVQGTTSTSAVVSGWLILDRLNQRGAFLWTGKRGSINTYSLDVAFNLRIHSTGPIPKSTTLVSDVTQTGVAPNEERSVIWLRGMDALVSLSSSVKTIAPQTMSGTLNGLEIEDGIRIESVSATLTLDVANSLAARQGNESLDDALSRLALRLQTQGSVLVE